ncbi:MAG TPA: DUF1289 domain-containing protein [Methylotenera sp.]
MTEIVQEEVQSPCIGVCSMDEASGYCAGCYRTIEEIKGWWNMSKPEQTQLVAELEQRQTQLVSFD